MDQVGPWGFYLFTATLFAALVIYAGWRATQRAPIPSDETGSYIAMSQTGTPVAMEIAQELAIESDLEEEEEGDAAA
jgi:hypothetical protein